MESANSPQNGLVYEYADAGVDESDCARTPPVPTASVAKRVTPPPTVPAVKVVVPC